ncbi:hypothetical protein NM688_g6137 [Phlebia brevispora]|uniref:Uncharacterized protein n=1 Tax=Phlebia brevispora TaxID=194682 RepID=A0ACC1SJK3_9APHY|nr:hypothetical protein NM688_g6137 [Phlebia brevispora]
MRSSLLVQCGVKRVLAAKLQDPRYPLWSYIAVDANDLAHPSSSAWQSALKHAYYAKKQWGTEMQVSSLLRCQSHTRKANQPTPVTVFVLALLSLPDRSPADIVLFLGFLCTFLQSMQMGKSIPVTVKRPKGGHIKGSATTSGNVKAV